MYNLLRQLPYTTPLPLHLPYHTLKAAVIFVITQPTGGRKRLVEERGSSGSSSVVVVVAVSIVAVAVAVVIVVIFVVAVVVVVILPCVIIYIVVVARVVVIGRAAGCVSAGGVVFSIAFSVAFSIIVAVIAAISYVVAASAANDTAAAAATATAVAIAIACHTRPKRLRHDSLQSIIIPYQPAHFLLVQMLHLRIFILVKHFDFDFSPLGLCLRFVVYRVDFDGVGVDEGFFVFDLGDFVLCAAL
jgi:hypothetical protein